MGQLMMLSVARGNEGVGIRGEEKMKDQRIWIFLHPTKCKCNLSGLIRHIFDALILTACFTTMG